MLEIVQVVLEFPLCFFEGRAILIAYLRPAGNTWPNHMTQIEIGNFIAEPLHELRTFRAWTNKSHVSAKDIPKLRNLIQARLAHKLSNPCNARIMFGGPHCAIYFGVLAHCTELIDGKGASSQANPLLLKKYRAGRRNPHGQNYHWDHRCANQQRYEGDCEGNKTTNYLMRRSHPETIGKNERARSDRFEWQTT